jgi:hypothetical protein
VTGIYWVVWAGLTSSGRERLDVALYTKERFQAAVAFMADLRRAGYVADIRRAL